MNILDLAQETKRLAEKATPGPYYASCGAVLTENRVIAECALNIEVNPEWAENSVFFAHSRTAAPQLADAVLSLTAELEEVKWSDANTVSRLSVQLAMLQAERDEMVEVLKFYAADKNYNEDGTAGRAIQSNVPGEPTEWDFEQDCGGRAHELLTKLGITEGGK